jgi:hypothetical protein
MKQKTLNLMLGAVALGLVGIVVVQQKKDEAKLAEPPKKGEPLTALVPTTIDHVSLHHANAPDIVLERKDGRWALTAPVQAPADSVEVSKLLLLANAESGFALDVSKIKRADFGLDPAQYTVTLDDTVLAFGNIETIKYLRYVEVDPGKPTDRVALVTDPDQSVVDSDYTDLLSKKLLPPDAEITRVELPGLVVEKQASGWLSQPASKDATQDDFQQFIDSWKSAAAIRTEPLEAPKGESKNLMARLTLGDGSTRSYLIVNREPQLILDDAVLKARYRFAPDVSLRLNALPKPKAAETAPKPSEAKPDAGAATAPDAASVPPK